MEKKNRSYMDSIHFSGRISCVISLVFFLLIPTVMCLHLNTWPEASVVLAGLGQIAPMFYPTGILEVIAYAPLLGAGGTYLSFITGNIMNLKMPCALSAMDNAKVKSNTEEGEVITTIAIAASTIVTTVIIAIFVVIFALNPSFSQAMKSDALSPAFKQVTYTIFGSLAATYFIKHWKITIFPIAAISLILVFAGSLPVGTLIIIGAVLSMLGAHVMYKLKLV